MRLRIVSWNVNGLRRVIAHFGSLDKFLSALEADVLCIQEHKLTRADLKRELALADGWESFFAFTRGRELRALDGEGRVVITEHGALVLVNVYGPAITSEERAEERGAFKMTFFRALQHRLDGFLAAGRRLVVLGDFNISPAAADRAGATPRTFEPHRPDRLRDAYTCWNTSSGARVNNFGSRIDLILAADGTPGADIMVDFQGSDHAPLCPGHGEACVIRTVKKKGENNGRQMQVDLITEWVDVVRCNDMFERVREVVSLRRMT
eukprot:XP_001692908.1 predicted protein [Chlamydomonas reinhardtii]